MTSSSSSSRRLTHFDGGHWCYRGSYCGTSGGWLMVMIFGVMLLALFNVTFESEKQKKSVTPS